MSDSQKFSDWLIETWCSDFTGIVETMTGSTVPVSHSQARARDFSSHGRGSWKRYRFSARADAFLWLRVPDETVHSLGVLIATASGLDGDTDQVQNTTWNEVAAQSMAALAGALSQRLGRQIIADTQIDENEPDETGAIYDVVIDSTEPLHLGVVFSPAMCVEADTTVAEVTRDNRPSATLKQGKVAEMDLVLEVELPLTVSFGRTYLPLRDVLKLSTGSIIELDRLINDPVDIMINNCVVARGEVVVIEGNYGIRVTDVVGREDRLALRNPGRPLLPFEEFRLNVGA